MLEQNICTLSYTSKFVLLKPCDNRILSHFQMKFLCHYTVILHSGTIHLFLLSKISSPHSCCNDPCIRYLLPGSTQWATLMLLDESSSLFLLRVDFADSFPSQLKVEPERPNESVPEVIQRSGGAQRHRGRRGGGTNYSTFPAESLTL